MCKIWPLAVVPFVWLCGEMDRGETHSGVYPKNIPSSGQPVETKVAAGKKW